ncbi:MAG: DUF4349 domain-containing protein [Coleofasciculus sp. S288]|nr:DUF4349 domain-containing protein [Coleofasciculus sp. S288]
MLNEPVSQMVRVPTPLIEGVRELSRLHRAGRTRAVLEGIKKLVAAIDSETTLDIDSVATAISTLTQRLDKLEKQRSYASNTDDIGSISTRLQKVETDIESIQSTMADLTARVGGVEAVGYIGNTVTPITELASSDIEAIAQPLEPTNTSSNIEENNNSDRTGLASELEPATGTQQPETPLTQSALAKRLGVSNHVVQKQKQHGRENFAAWSKQRDPDGIAWSWQGKLWKGKPMRFVPASSNKT